MSNLEQLETKIRKLCPELQELSMWCEVRHYFNWKVWQFLWMIDEHGSCDCYVSYDCGATISRDDMSDLRKCIIWHPIHLEHILKCLWKEYATVGDGYVLKRMIINHNQDKWFNFSQAQYDLSLPLNEQSEETIEFLNNTIS